MAQKKIDPDAIIAEDNFIADVQFAIHNLMELKGKSRADLARALDVSEARVSQLFQDDTKNLTLRTVAKIFHALGEDAQITSKLLQEIIPVRSSIELCAVPRNAAVTKKAAMVQALLCGELRAHAAFAHEANDNHHETDLVAA